MGKFSYVSLGGEPIEVDGISEYFILIDPLYASEIRNSGDNVSLEIAGGYASVKKDLQNIDEKFFPYGGGLLGFVANVSPPLVVDVGKIKDIEHSSERFDFTFSIDSGIVAVVAANAFPTFCQFIDYDDLVSHTESKTMIERYVSQLHQMIGGKFCGFIFSPGIDRGFDFVGSGEYQLILD